MIQREGGGKLRTSTPVVLHSRRHLLSTSVLHLLHSTLYSLLILLDSCGRLGIKEEGPGTVGGLVVGGAVRELPTLDPSSSSGLSAVVTPAI